MIKCLVCNKEFGFINHTHLSMHGMTTKDYLTRFPDASLCDDEYRRNASKASIARGAKPPIIYGPHWSRRGIHPKVKDPEARARKISEALHNSPTFKAHSERMKVERLKENNPNWKGGCHPAVYSLSFPEQEIIKRRIRKRDNYCCVICDKYLDGFINEACVHHKNHDKTDWRDENLVTMCNVHHSATNHGKTIEQVNQEHLTSLSTNLM